MLDSPSFLSVSSGLRVNGNLSFDRSRDLFETTTLYEVDESVAKRDARGNETLTPRVKRSSHKKSIRLWLCSWLPDSTTPSAYQMLVKQSAREVKHTDLLTFCLVTRRSGLLVPFVTRIKLKLPLN